MPSQNPSSCNRWRFQDRRSISKKQRKIGQTIKSGRGIICSLICLIDQTTIIRRRSEMWSAVRLGSSARKLWIIILWRERRRLRGRTRCTEDRWTRLILNIPRTKEELLLLIENVFRTLWKIPARNGLQIINHKPWKGYCWSLTVTYLRASIRSNLRQKHRSRWWISSCKVSPQMTRNTPSNRSWRGTNTSLA